MLLSFLSATKIHIFHIINNHLIKNVAFLPKNHHYLPYSAKKSYIITGTHPTMAYGAETGADLVG